MDISFYQEKNLSGKPPYEIFAAIENIHRKMSNNYRRQLQLGLIDIEEDYKPAIQFMANLLNSLSYSDDFKCSIKCAAISFAETVLCDPFYIEHAKRWKSVKKSERDLENFARVMQGKINKSLSSYRNWGECNRETSIELVYQEPQSDIFGNIRILGGSYGFIGARTAFNQSRISTQKHHENIRLNYHPLSWVENSISWLSVLFHENVHAIEEIERQRVRCKPISEIANDIDAQLLLTNDVFPQSADFRRMCYDA